MAIAAVAILLLAAALGPAIRGVAGLPPPDLASEGGLDRYGEPLGLSLTHPLGTDESGRDVLSRLLHAAPVTLAIAITAALLATVIGVAVGLASGASGGLADVVLGRLTDAVLCFPAVLLALGVATACSTGEGCLGGALQPGAPFSALVIGTTTWGPCARVVRAQAVALRAAPFVEAARAAGSGRARIALHEMLPNVVPTVLVMLTFAVPGAMLLEGALSLLGAGVPAPAVTWGGMLAASLPAFDVAPWAVVAPAAAILVAGSAAAALASRVQSTLGRGPAGWRTV